MDINFQKVQHESKYTKNKRYENQQNIKQLYTNTQYQDETGTGVKYLEAVHSLRQRDRDEGSTGWQVLPAAVLTSKSDDEDGS